MKEIKKSKVSIRKRANEIKPFFCKNLIAVLEEPRNRENIGTVIRNVNALGVEKVYIIDSSGNVFPDDWKTLRYNSKLIKISASGIKWTFTKTFSSTEECLAHLKKNNFISAVTSPHTKGKTNVVLHEGDYTKYTKLAIWFGNETRGISELAVQESELCINIPMFGMIESLNLGTCSGIVLYEVAKQRRAYQTRFHRRRRNRKILSID